jgi:hypothetical protein
VIAALIGRWHTAVTPPKVVAAESLTARRKNISQSIVNAGYFPQCQAPFERIMLDPKG